MIYYIVGTSRAGRVEPDRGQDMDVASNNNRPSDGDIREIRKGTEFDYPHIRDAVDLRIGEIR